MYFRFNESGDRTINIFTFDGLLIHRQKKEDKIKSKKADEYFYSSAFFNLVAPPRLELGTERL